VKRTWNQKKRLELKTDPDRVTQTAFQFPLLVDVRRTGGWLEVGKRLPGRRRMRRRIRWGEKEDERSLSHSKPG